MLKSQDLQMPDLKLNKYPKCNFHRKVGDNFNEITKDTSATKLLQPNV